MKRLLFVLLLFLPAFAGNEFAPVGTFNVERLNDQAAIMFDSTSGLSFVSFPCSSEESHVIKSGLPIGIKIPFGCWRKMEVISVEKEQK